MKMSEFVKGLDLTKLGTITTEQGLEDFLNARATELKVKVLVDDGQTDVYVPKARLDEEIGKKKTIKDQLDKTAKDLEDFQKAHKDDENLSKLVEDLKKEKADMDSKFKAQSIDNAIKLKAIAAGAIDTTGADVLPFIDKSKMVLKDDGTVEGLDEAFKTLQESKSYLFGEVDKGGTGSFGKGRRGPTGPESGKLGEELAKQNATVVTTATEARAGFFK